MHNPVLQPLITFCFALVGFTIGFLGTTWWKRANKPTPPPDSVGDWTANLPKEHGDAGSWSVSVLKPVNNAATNEPFLPRTWYQPTLITGMTLEEQKSMMDAWRSGEQVVADFDAKKFNTETVHTAAPRCLVATDKTEGVFYCTRETGHDGPCAAVLNPNWRQNL